jgi:hypothetical protein
MPNVAIAVAYRYAGVMNSSSAYTYLLQLIDLIGN